MVITGDIMGSVLTAKWKYPDNKRDSPDSWRSMLMEESCRTRVFDWESFWVHERQKQILRCPFSAGSEIGLDFQCFRRRGVVWGVHITKCCYSGFSSLLMYFTRIQIAPQTDFQTTHFKSIISPPWGTAEEICLTRIKDQHVIFSKHLQLLSQTLW